MKIPRLAPVPDYQAAHLGDRDPLRIVAAPPGASVPPIVVRLAFDEESRAARIQLGIAATQIPTVVVVTGVDELEDATARDARAWGRA